jgi:peptide/nickel transport system substrate-binding protein
MSFSKKASSAGALETSNLPFCGNDDHTNVIPAKTGPRGIHKNQKAESPILTSCGSSTAHPLGDFRLSSRYLSAIFLILCASGFLPGCTETRDVQSPLYPDSIRNVLRFDVYEPFYSLDPSESETGIGGSCLVFPFLYSRLFIPNESWQPEPDLATAWDYDPDTFTWTIHLRDPAFFHDSRQVTADDVKYSLETNLGFDPSASALIKRITCQNQTTLRLALNQNDPDFLKKILGVEIIPNPRGREEAQDHQPVGSGPFRFSYKKGDKEVGLIANENYYLGRPALDKVIFHFEPDKEQSWSRLLSGKTDLALGIDPQDYEMIQQFQDKFHFNTTVDLYRTLLLLNTDDPLFSDAKVRLALAHAIDKEYIVKVILGDMGVVASGTMGYHSPYRNPELQPIPYDPEKSLRLLQESGWYLDRNDRYLRKDGKLFEFTILFHVESQLHERVAQFARLCLNKIGIVAHLQPLSYQETVNRFFNDLDVFQVIIADYLEVYKDSQLERLWCPLNGKRSLGGSFEGSSHAIRLIAEARQEQDSLRKNRLLLDLDSLLNSLQPAIFLYQRTSLNVLAKRFRPDFPFTTSPFYHFHLWSLSPTAE